VIEGHMIRKLATMLYRLLGVITVLLLLVGCNDVSETNEPISKSSFMLGTVVSISVYGIEDETIFTQVFDRLKEIEAKMSKTIETSEISRINIYSETSDINKQLEIDSDVFNVIERAIEYGDKSNDRFDITLAPIVELWGIGTEKETIPEKEDINKLLTTVGQDKIKINSKNNISISQNTQIDLGGIAKGYAADEVERMLRESGVNKAIINLGGNVKVIGEKNKGIPFKIGIQDPISERNNYLGIVEVTDKTIVTSGDYERYFEVDGIRYHHIFDPTTGYPFETNVASVTVIGDESIVADVMSTILYLMDINEGIEFVDTLEGVDCIYVTKDKEIYLSNGSIQEQFELTNEDYKLMDN